MTEQQKKDLATELLEISEDVGFIANSVTGYTAWELREYVRRLADLSKELHQSERVRTI